jgi:HlyD family secretion protein
VQFSSGQQYGGTEWIVEIPNTRSSSYATNQSSYDVARTTATAAIEAAEDALTLAEREAGLTTAGTRSEDILAAAAAVAEARARVAAIDASLADRSILAPFAGVVTEVDIVKGETATQAPVVTLLASDAFELKARVPEIDITKLTLGQPVIATFDADSDVPISGQIGFISPIATEIDGVAYFEIVIDLSERPEWLRAGLNADIDIIVAEARDVLRVPRRFITSTETPTVLVAQPDGSVATTSVTLGVLGNDGFIEITGVAEGTTIVAP